MRILVLVAAAVVVLSAANIIPKLTYPGAGPNQCSDPASFGAPVFCAHSPLPLPPQGGKYVDPNFGSTVEVMTPVSGDFIHQYSTPTAFSATGKYILVAANHSNGAWTVIDRATDRTVVAADVLSYDRFWDAQNDDFAYYIIKNKIYRFSVSQNRSKLIVDYSRAPHNFTEISAGGTGDTSKDNWFAFFAEHEHNLCVVNLSNPTQTYCYDYFQPSPVDHMGPHQIGAIDYVQISKGIDSTTGKRYVWMSNAPAAYFSYDPKTNEMRLESRPEMYTPETGAGPNDKNNNDGICDPHENCMGTPHADTTEDAQGRQYLVTSTGVAAPTCSNVMSAMWFGNTTGFTKSVKAGGGRTDWYTQTPCGNIAFYQDIHVSCSKSAPFCSISEEATNAATLGPYINEIVVVKDFGKELRRVAKNNNAIDPKDYWSQPRASISNDGAYVLWTSDWNGSLGGKHVVLMATTGLGAQH